MTVEEYRKRYREICTKFDADMDELKTEYLKSTFPYKVGDIVEDNMGRGRIVSLDKKYYSTANNGLPYYRLELELVNIRNITRWTESYNIK